jgi:hypothetical protein
MPKQWDIVEVPGEVWPAEGSDESFLAVIVSSAFASEKANIYWVCPIRSSAGKRVEEGFVPLKQEFPPAQHRSSWFAPAPRRPLRQPTKLDPSKDMVRADLVITVTRHEMKATDYGRVDLKTRKQMAQILKRFAAFTAPVR